MIPRVREWRVRMVDGRVFRVLAPTRLLAILNLRAEPGRWGPIRSCAVLRRTTGQRTLVEEEGRG